MKMNHKIIRIAALAIVFLSFTGNLAVAYLNADEPLWNKSSLSMPHPNFSEFESFLGKPESYEFVAIFKNFLKTTNLEDFNKLTQEELDGIYSLLPSGPIPHGKFKGAIIMAKDGPVNYLSESMANKEMANSLEKVGEFLWKGKVFNNQTKVLQNRISFFGLERLLFPAKLYCGQSRLDSRRESIIIDYAYNETITEEGMYNSGPAFGGNIVPALRKPLDMLVGRKGFNIRDEIRMVRPGLYLGRAYMQNIFLLNFVLQIEDPNEPGNIGNRSESDCWQGTQKGILAATSK